jgi:CheY-like chemotaxis protein
MVVRLVAEASNGLEAVAAAARFKPTVILMDIRMPELDGLQATRQILAADDTARILILTTFDFDQYVYEALRAGASGGRRAIATSAPLAEPRAGGTSWVEIPAIGGKATHEDMICRRLAANLAEDVEPGSAAPSQGEMRPPGPHHARDKDE